MNQEIQPGSDIPRDSRKWAMFCHLMALTGLLANGIGFLLGPLIVWLVKKEDHPFVDEQGKEAVNFQITMLMVMLAGGLLTMILVGFVVLAIGGLMMTIFPIIAAIQANDGKHYRYPLTIRLIH